MGVELEIKGKGVEHDISALATQFALPTSKAHDLLWDEYTILSKSRAFGILCLSSR